MRHLFLVLPVFCGWACVSSNEYIHDTDTQDAQRQAAIQEAASNAETFRQLMGTMNGMIAGLSAGQASTQAAGNSGWMALPAVLGQTMAEPSSRTPTSPGLMSMFAAGAAPASMGGTSAGAKNNGAAQKLQLISKFLEACQSGDNPQAGAFLSAAATQFSKDEKQKAALDQMNTLFNLLQAQSSAASAPSPGSTAEPGPVPPHPASPHGFRVPERSVSTMEWRAAQDARQKAMLSPATGSGFRPSSSAETQTTEEAANGRDF